MAWLTGKLAIGIAGALAAAALIILYLHTKDQRDVARGERDVARAQAVTLQLALDVEVISTKAAADAAGRCNALVTEQDRRCTAALADDRAQATRYRAQLRGCLTPSVLEERFRALSDPSSRPVTP